MKEPDDKTGKKTYRPPKLTIYGTLREITQTSSVAGAKNDKTTGMNKSA